DPRSPASPPAPFAGPLPPASRLRASWSPATPWLRAAASARGRPWAPLRTIIWSTAPNGLAAASTIAGHCSASCWPMTASWFSARASALALIASASAMPPASTASPSAAPPPARGAGPPGLPDQPGRLRAGDGLDPDPLGLGDRLQPDPLGRPLGVQLDLLAPGPGGGDAGVAAGLGQGDRLIGLGVGRLADAGLEALLLPLGLQLGDLGLLADHLLAGRGVGPG